MRIQHFLFVVVCMLCGQRAMAQTKVNELVKEWERSKIYTKEYMDAMPETSYVFKPTPQMRSFAEQLLHLADANYGLSAAATGAKSPVAFGELEKTGDKSKAHVTELVMASYDFVIEQVRKMTDAQLDEQVKLLGRFDVSKGIGLFKALEHQAHHRGQTTVYLRLAGVTPPQEKLF